MILSLFSWVLLAGTALLCLPVIGLYMKSRSVSTKVLALASKEFFENADKLMKTPEKLPDTVLEGLKIMSESLNNDDGSCALLRGLCMANSDPDGHKRPSKLRKDVEEMNPDLQEIFDRAVVGWLNFVTHRCFVLQQKIRMELNKMAIKKHHSGIDGRDAGISALARVVET